MIYGYIRSGVLPVSVELQQSCIELYAKSHDWNKIKFTKGDIFIVERLGRLGQGALASIVFLKNLIASGVCIHSVKDSILLNNKEDRTLLCTSLSLAEKIIKDCCSLSTQEALSLRKSNGKKLGRVQGVKNKKLKLDDKQEKLCRLLREGLTFQIIGKRLGVHDKTIKRYLELHPELAEGTNIYGREASVMSKGNPKAEGYVEIQSLATSRSPWRFK